MAFFLISTPAMAFEVDKYTELRDKGSYKAEIKSDLPNPVITIKQYDPNTGEFKGTFNQEISISEIDQRIAYANKEISNLTAMKSDINAAINNKKVDNG